MVHRDGRIKGPLVSAGKVAAAAAGEVAAEVFVMVIKTGGEKNRDSFNKQCAVDVFCNCQKLVLITWRFGANHTVH